MGFPGGPVVKNLPTKQETQVESVDQEVPLEKKLATHSNILAEELPQTEEPGRLQSMGLQSWTWLSDDTTTTNNVVYLYNVMQFGHKKKWNTDVYHMDEH